MSKGFTTLSVKVFHSDGDDYTISKDSYGVKIKYVSDRGATQLEQEIYIPLDSVPAIIHALNFLSQTSKDTE